jgi:non-heme chloroperoxidase
VLISSVVPYLLKTEDNPDGVDTSIFADMKAQIRRQLCISANLRQAVLRRWAGSNPVSQGILDWSFLLAAMASPKATLNCVDAFGKTDFRPDLSAITVPGLIIHGTSDKTMPIEASGRAAAKAIRGAKLIEYDGEPHGLFATAPDRLNADLKEFIG